MNSLHSLRRAILNHWPGIVLWLLLVLLVMLIYQNSMGGPFIFDDRPNIELNPHIRLTRLTWEGLRVAGFEAINKVRPVANISFALNYYVHQYDVRGYHLVNVLIHLLNGILLYLILRRTLHDPASWIPFCSVLLWLIHPIHTQTVSYIVQRMNSLAALFYLLSLLLYILARTAEKKRNRWLLFAGCLAAAFLAFRSKEIAVTLPLFIFLYEWYFIRGLSGAWLRRHLTRGAVFYLPLLAALLYLGRDLPQRIINGYAVREFTMGERVLTEFRVVVLYISQLFCPHPYRLNLDHDFPVSRSLVDPLSTLAAIILITGLFVLAIVIARKHRLASFGILWFLGNLVLESSVVGLELVFEHRTYLPSMFAAPIAALLICRCIQPKQRTIAALCLVTLLLSTWTYQRNKVWADDELLWLDCVQKSPEKARPHYNLACLYARRNSANRACKWLERTITRPDFNSRSRYVSWDLIRIDADLENIRNTARYRELIRRSIPPHRP